MTVSTRLGWVSERLLPGFIYAGSTGLGILAFALPFWRQSAAAVMAAPLLTVTLLVLCLVVLMLELQGGAMNAKAVATLGLLIAVNASLRFVEQVVPGPGGFSPVFVPILLASYIFGSRFGFLLGALTLLVSAMATGGVGPWLPYQMFAAGWLGLSAGWLPKPQSASVEIGMLAIAGLLWGYLYGIILNLYFWPLFVGDPAHSFPASGTIADIVRHYGRFYLVTSLAWDTTRAIGNVALVLTLGPSVIRVFRRFARRFKFTLVGPTPAPESVLF